MTIKSETLARCRVAFEVLNILLDRIPTQREVARAAPATSVTVSTLWHEITSDPEDLYQSRAVPAARKCLICGHKFPSYGAGNRICQRCKGLNIWQTGIVDIATVGGAF
jgi:hypothetical protein